MRRNGFRNITPAVKGKNSVEDGVEFLKSYDIVVHPSCVHTSDELSKYSYKVDRLTGEVLPIFEDGNNHVVDSLRYSMEGQRLAPGPLIVSKLILAKSRLPQFRRQYV